jgi:nucleoside-diphosphate-sugar epimerase
MALLVTGAAGFVALNLLENRLRAGEDVIAFDLAPLPEAALVAFAGLPGRLIRVQGDVRSAADLDRAFAAARVSAVLHAAAVTAGEARERSAPAAILQVNLGGSVAVLEAARRHGVARFVAPSSIAVYGAPPAGAPWLDEATTPCRPLALYGISKLAAEQAVLRLAALHGLSAATPRLSVVYGPWEHASGARDLLSPVRQALALALAGEAARWNAAPEIDHIHAGDVAEGLAALLATPTATGVFNLGSGRVSTIADWCEALALHLPGFRFGPAQGEPNLRVLPPIPRPPMALAGIAAATGWRPRRADPRAAVAEWAAGGWR